MYLTLQKANRYYSFELMIISLYLYLFFYILFLSYWQSSVFLLNIIICILEKCYTYLYHFCLPTHTKKTFFLFMQLYAKKYKVHKHILEFNDLNKFIFHISHHFTVLNLFNNVIINHWFWKNNFFFKFERLKTRGKNQDILI